MKPADDGMHLLNPGHGLCLPDRIDDPRWLHEERTTSPLPLSTKLVAISCSKSSGMNSPVFFASGIFSGKQPKPLTMPTFSLVGCSGFSELTCAILPVAKA